ncbi:hypothetical protein CCP3SC1_570006 [Gammaproteobacteria bacterium]
MVIACQVAIPKGEHARIAYNFTRERRRVISAIRRIDTCYPSDEAMTKTHSSSCYS